MICKKTFFTLLVVATVLLPNGRHPARAWMATEFTQILNNLELVGIESTEIEALAQQADQLMNEATMIENQLKNLRTLDNNPLAMINALERLSNIVQQGQIVSYAAQNIDALYAHMYPGYTTYLNQDISSAVLQQKHLDWSQRNTDNIKATLKASGIQEQTLLNEQDRMDTIVSMSKTSEGRLQAIQAGNLIAAEEVSSLQRLRQLIMVNNQHMANYQAQQQDKEDVNAAKWQQVTGGATTVLGDERSIIDDF
ncbi:MAG: P-type conjugative transfer protein TrbJ [Desulfobulbaceae bacterium]|nr:P-type conjugative transfer protein TrbJ [Desulfobulbaceae bacterium]